MHVRSRPASQVVDIVLGDKTLLHSPGHFSLFIQELYFLLFIFFKCMTNIQLHMCM